MLKERVITALVVAPLAVLAVFMLPGVWFGAVMAAVFAIGAHEWSNLAFPGRWLPAWLLAGVILLACALLLWGDTYALVLMLVSVPFWLLGLLWLTRPVLSVPGWIKYLSAVPVLLGAWAGVHRLQGDPLGPWLLCTLVLLVWGADVGAYIAGRLFGRYKLAPRISPGKTWEGVGGGLVLAGGVALFSAWLMDLENPDWFVLICVAAALLSVAGDLIESILKRQAGTKDSGVLLPGHGGILDRVDSLLIATPVFVLGLAWLGVL